MQADIATPVIAKPCRSHEDATIESFAKDPEYAAAYLNAVLEDGDYNLAHLTGAVFAADRERKAIFARVTGAAN